MTTTGYGFTDYKIGTTTSIFGLDWGIEYTTTTGYAASGEDADDTWWSARSWLRFSKFFNSLLY